jgi:hypothetical protein
MKIIIFSILLMPGYSLSNINLQKTQNCDIGSSYSGWGFFEHQKQNEKSGPRVLRRPNAKIEPRTRFGPSCFIIL